jgi:hypothetical protein
MDAERNRIYAMKIEDILKRVDDLIALGEKTLSSQTEHEMGGSYVEQRLFHEFRSSGLSFLARTFETNSPFYLEFNKHVEDTGYYCVERGIGIMKAVRSEIDGGWLFTTRGLISAEVFADFAEMSEHLLKENYKDPAAVMMGSVLEEHLRQLCNKNSIPIESTRPDGSMAPLKADTMNAELARKNIYSKLDQKNVTAQLDLRNKAAHGLYKEYTESQVEMMIKTVSDFITRNPL